MGKIGDNRDENRRRELVSKLMDQESWKKSRTLPPANETWPTCLIIAPSSVVPNWEREFHKWSYFEVGVYANGKEERSQVLKDFKYGRLDVVITSFDLARKDIKLLDDLPWSCIIVDEVHRVKNPKSKLTDAFNEFRCHIRFGLTGTAIQNSFSELWTILDWANRGSVGTRNQWESYVSKPLMRGQSKSASAEELSNAYEVARILRDILLPKFFLRRTKELIKDQLPQKTDEVVFCPLAFTQIEAYKRVLQTKAVRNLLRKDCSCECGSKKPRKSCCHKSDQGDLFKYMSTLIKISNHLALILPAPTDKAEQVLRNRELSEQIFPRNAVPKYGTAMLNPNYCGKWRVLESLLKEWHKDKSNKVLIFTKSVKLLEMLDYHLKAQGLGHVKLDGQVKQNDRMGLIDQFQEDPDIFVFLISTMAGGTGLNLTAANKVVIFDPNWNPAHDLQAMDRAYRYGQTRNVSVYRLLGAGSLEELIYARQVYKQQQMAVGYTASFQTRYFEGVQGDKTKQGELFGIKNIFKLHEETLATKMAIEKATMSDLDWALANIKPERKPDGTKWVYEAEAKGKKIDSELNGLGALLFDDIFVPKSQGEDPIQKALKDIGVKYTHRNEDLIAENPIQQQRLKHYQDEKIAQKAAKGKGKNAPLVREKTWPPKRSHHKPAPTPAQKLQARQKALLELGLVDSIDDLPTFAQEFARKSQTEQNEILSRLDKHIR
ncbi:P-loop containing nucleoside triphosphate hydrolase protein [Irpex rosettiformis]|uniref:P-loop containing nucleoside triphosphate hydrolase protein n=1 Tax=Irpex rosettiformis TaxID=378272 RepID=A0ACB8TU82_9APHY|nr:P-loop containing nucleoside triphosphate hydrolase protein [Irpex rosettiformis]